LDFTFYPFIDLLFQAFVHVTINATIVIIIRAVDYFSQQTELFVCLTDGEKVQTRIGKIRIGEKGVTSP
jgi:hypothetical protein